MIFLSSPHPPEGIWQCLKTLVAVRAGWGGGFPGIWWVGARVLLSIPLCPGQPPIERMIWPKVSVLPNLRKPDLDNNWRTSVTRVTKGQEMANEEEMKWDRAHLRPSFQWLVSLQGFFLSPPKNQGDIAGWLFLPNWVYIRERKYLVL